LAAAGALAILLQDAIRTNDWQLEHGLIPVLMAVQILTAHSVVNALRSRCWGSALGFAVVAAVATWGVLYTSVGKQTKVAAEASAVAGDVNELRSDLKKRLAANQDMLDAARVKMAAECASGRGQRCKGLEATVKVYEDAVAGNLAALAKAGNTKPVAANADKMAELLALITGKDRGSIKHTLLLLEPFTYATIFELAALVSFGFAFGIRRRPATIRPAATDTAQSSFAAATVEPPETDPPRGNRRRRKVSGQPSATVLAFPVPSSRRPATVSELGARAWLHHYMESNRCLPSQDEMATDLNVNKGTVARWMKKWEAEGLIVREQSGRCKVVTMA
jgi:hypothetical protein